MIEKTTGQRERETELNRLINLQRPTSESKVLLLIRYSSNQSRSFSFSVFFLYLFSYWRSQDVAVFSSISGYDKQKRIQIRSSCDADLRCSSTHEFIRLSSLCRISGGRVSTIVVVVAVDEQVSRRLVWRSCPCCVDRMMSKLVRRRRASR